MEHLFNQWLESKRHEWSPSTIKTTRQRLQKWLLLIEAGRADNFYDALAASGLSPYSRVTAFSSAISFYDYLIEVRHKEGPNAFKLFRRSSARLFRNVYTPKLPTISFEEAEARIKSLESEAIRNKALQLLYTGMRISESETLAPDGTVIGKGNKPRQVFSPHNLQNVARIPQSTLRFHLTRIGLTPHMLRKIFLSKLVAQGAGAIDLKTVAGWSNINTAVSYIAIDNTNLAQLVERATGVKNELSRSLSKRNKHHGLYRR